MKTEVLLHFSDERKFFKALRWLRAKNVTVEEYHTPSVEEKELRVKRVWRAPKLGTALLFAGAIGALAGFFVQYIWAVWKGESLILGADTVFAPFLSLSLIGAALFVLVVFVLYMAFDLSERDGIMSVLPKSDGFYLLCLSENEEHQRAIEEVQGMPFA